MPTNENRPFAENSIRPVKADPLFQELLAVMEWISIAHASVSAVSICEAACRTWPRLSVRSWASPFHNWM